MPSIYEHIPSGKHFLRERPPLLSITSSADGLYLLKPALALICAGRSLPQHKQAIFQFIIPVDNAIAIQSVDRPKPLHSDPVDRIIIATAISLGASLVTNDEKISNYPHVKTVWSTAGVCRGGMKGEPFVLRTTASPTGDVMYRY